MNEHFAPTAAGGNPHRLEPHRPAGAGSTRARGRYETMLDEALHAMNTNHRTTIRAGLLGALSLAAATATAHHSAALFYDLEGHAEVSGTVTEFRFANPHAILKLDVVGEDGEIQHWTAETTSPSILRRRGWSQQSFTPGEKVRIEGLPSADGSYLIRIQRAFREDGTEIGIPRGTDN
jgi:hypothetical protein